MNTFIDYLNDKDLLRSINIDLIRKHLQNNRYTVMHTIKSNPPYTLWTHPRIHPDSFVQPDDKSATDYKLRVAELLITLSDIERKSVFEIFNDMNDEYTVEILISNKQ